MNTSPHYTRVLSVEHKDAIVQESTLLQSLRSEVNKVLVGQEQAIDFILMALLCEGHILLEGVPGVAKTTMVKTMAAALGLHFKRIQFTPDLLPADLIGTLIYNPKTCDFETRKGPIFANLVLADEINRAPAKVQAALLEAMQEQQVTIGSTTFFLDRPFLVFATQNPIEQEGTYRLPEAQLDRFMFKVLIDYPSLEQERSIIKKHHDNAPIVSIVTKEDLERSRTCFDMIYVDEKIIEYIMALVFATRNPQAYNVQHIAHYIKYGVSPRATIALYNAARAQAFLKKRHFVTPDDVKAVALAVLRHRLVLSYEADADEINSDALIKIILNKIPTP
jgi:MoxR-like ATPase